MDKQDFLIFIKKEFKTISIVNNINGVESYCIYKKIPMIRLQFILSTVINKKNNAYINNYLNLIYFYECLLNNDILYTIDFEFHKDELINILIYNQNIYDRDNSSFIWFKINIQFKDSELFIESFNLNTTITLENNNFNNNDYENKAKLLKKEVSDLIGYELLNNLTSLNLKETKNIIEMMKL